jgi:uncharacterized protein
LQTENLLDFLNGIVTIATADAETVRVDISGIAVGRGWKHMKELSQIIQTILNHHPNVQTIYLFGSYGTEDERPDSDVDIALLLSPGESKSVGSPLLSKLHLELELLLDKDVDLINLREVSTVLQKEVVAAGRCIYQGDKYAGEEFEMLTLSQYQKLNEERKGIIESALAGGRFHKV